MSETPSGAYIPAARADVDRTSIQKRPRKFDDNQKLMKRNSQGWFEYVVKVVSATYNHANHRWEYTLLDFAGKPIEGTTKETDLQ